MHLLLISSAGSECQATLDSLWRSMGWIMRADVVLLTVMLAYVVAITCGRILRFASSRRHSRLFVRQAASALQDGNINQTLALAIQHSRGHIAKLVAAGLAAFAESAPHLTDAEAAEAAERAFRRARGRLVADLKRGVSTLTSITFCAPLIGFVGTFFGIVGAFVMAHGLSSLAGGLAQALVTTAFGLLVAIPAFWCRNYIVASVEAFEMEMSNSVLETMTYCESHRNLRPLLELQNAGNARHGSVLDDISGTRSWEIPYDRPRGLLLLVSFYTLVLVFFFVVAVIAALTGAR